MTKPSQRIDSSTHVSNAVSRLAGRPVVRALRDACAARGLEAWIVGGALRDAALGLPAREIHEIDTAVQGDPEPLARDLEAAGHGRAVFVSRDRPGPRVFRVAGEFSW